MEVYYLSICIDPDSTLVLIDVVVVLYIIIVEPGLRPGKAKKM